MARYSVMKSVPPPATRLMTPKRPPPPAIWVCVVSWMELLIQESSPASEMIASLGSRMNSSTGMVVPTICDCMETPDSVSIGLRCEYNLGSNDLELHSSAHGRRDGLHDDWVTQSGGAK